MRTPLLFLAILIAACNGSRDLSTSSPVDLPEDSYWQVAFSNKCGKPAENPKNTYPVHLIRMETKLLWENLGWNTARGEGAISTDGSFTLHFDESRGNGVHRGRIAPDGQSFQTVYESAYCKYAWGTRYPGPQLCRIWPDDARERTAAAVTQATAADTALAEYKQFWAANQARFAGTNAQPGGVYAWNGGQWRAVTDATPGYFEFEFRFEDGSRLDALNDYFGPSIQLTHAGGWAFSFGHGSSSTTFSLDGRWSEGESNVWMNPEFSSSTPIGTWSEANEMSNTDTYTIHFQGFDLYAKFENGGETILRYNGKERKVSPDERTRLCPGLEDEIRAMLPDPSAFVDLAGPKQVAAFLYP